MENRRFEKGRCYFLVGYLDREFKFPFVDTYVFLGMRNGERSARTWMFQDVHSFFKFGEQRDADEANEIDVLALDENGLETILDAQGLAAEFERLGV